MGRPKKLTAVKAPPQTEHQIQSEIVKILRIHGYDVMVTTAYMQKGASGVQKGIPDLLVHREDWGPGVLVGLEVKRPGGKFTSYEQELAWLCGQTIVVDSVLAALAAVENRGTDVAPALIASKMMTNEERTKRIAELIIKIEVAKMKKRTARRAGVA